MNQGGAGIVAQPQMLRGVIVAAVWRIRGGITHIGVITPWRGVTIAATCTIRSARVGAPH